MKPRSVLILMLVLPGLAGCLSGGDDADPEGSADDAALLEEVTFDGVEVTHRDETMLTLLWEDTMPAGSTFPEAPDELGKWMEKTLRAPPGRSLGVWSTLTWETGADLSVHVLDPDGRFVCQNFGPGTQGVSFDEIDEDHIRTCRGMVVFAADAERTLLFRLGGDHVEEPTPFRMEVKVFASPAPYLSPAAGLFEEPKLVGIEADVETSLFIAPDDTMLVCSHGAFDGKHPVWISEDGGDTWREEEPMPDFPTDSGDCDVAITDDAWYFMVNTYPASVMVASSLDRGEIWQVNEVAAYPVAGTVDRPWLMPDGQDILLTYANLAGALPGVHFFTRSTDHGQTFPVHTPMGHADPAGDIRLIPGHPILWDDGQEILMPVIGLDDGLGLAEAPGHVLLERSHDGGTTWETVVVGMPHEGPLSLPGAARTPDGTIVLSYATGEIDHAAFELIWSRDDGTTWSDPLLLADGLDFRAVATAFLDPRSDGTVTATWMTEQQSQEWMPGHVIHAARIDPDAEEPVLFSGPVLFEEGTRFVYEFIMVRHDSQDRAHIAYVVDKPGCGVDERDLMRGQSCVYLLSERPPS